MDDTGGGGSFVALGGFCLGSIAEVLATHLLDRGVELLPDVLQQQLKAGSFPEIGSENIPAISDLRNTQDPILISLLFKNREFQQEGNGFTPEQH